MTRFYLSRLECVLALQAGAQIRRCAGGLYLSGDRGGGRVHHATLGWLKRRGHCNNWGKRYFSAP